MLIGFFGLYLTIFQGAGLTSLTESQNILGNLIALTAVVCIALGTIFQKKYNKSKFGLSKTSSGHPRSKLRGIGRKSYFNQC